VLRLIEGPVWIAIGVVICAAAYATGLGTFREPGAGFVAAVAGLFIIAVGSVVSVTRGSGPEKEEKVKAISNSTRMPLVQCPAFKMAYTVAILLFYAIFLNPLGYIVTTFIALFALFYDLSRRRWAVPLFASVVSVAVTYIVFEVWLKSQLPRGILPWW
jgi:hypothetical protein